MGHPPRIEIGCARVEVIDWGEKAMFCPRKSVFRAAGLVFLVIWVGQPQQRYAQGDEPIDRPHLEQVEGQSPLPDGRGSFVEPQDPNHHQLGGWHLGVHGHYTSTGHLLTQVFPNTPAARAGLEPGDRIVTVNGFQVGNVNDRQYPIDFLLQRYASPQGFVRLLVQNRRTLQLVNLDVRLARGRIHF